MRRFFLIALIVSFLLVPAISAATVDLQMVAGYLADEYEIDSIVVDCEKDEQTFRFEWEKTSDFWVKVLGMSGNELGDFQLSEGGDIILTGGGKFTLKVYSNEGGGKWSVEPVEE